MVSNAMTGRQPNLAYLALLDWEAKEEKARQKAIAQARDYYEGMQLSYLSARLREILSLPANTSSPDTLFHLNICDKVVTASTERLNVTGFKPDDAEWAAQIWQVNRLDALQNRVYEMARRDGEAFVIVDVSQDPKSPRLVIHPRFVGADNGGDGYGCRAVYPNDDDAQPMRYAVKRWTEDYNADDEASTQSWTDSQKQARKRQRMTLYYPDHVEKYALDQGKWVPTRDVGDTPDAQGWIPWVDSAGKPLGIPVVHFRNRNLHCEIDSSVVAMQNLLNKTLIDLAETADQAAFRVWVALGFVPTSDGKPLESDGSNRVVIKPNMVIGTSKSQTEASLEPKPGESPAPLIELIDKIMLWVAQSKDIPPSRFLLGGNTPAAETQKQLDSPLLALIRQLQVAWGDSWEDCMYVSRTLMNAFGNAGIDENALIETTWENAAVRADDRDDPLSFWQAISAAVQSMPGMNVDGLLKRYGWSETDIESVTGDGVMRDLAGNTITQ